jgi:arylsulfatase A-like enzyme
MGAGGRGPEVRAGRLGFGAAIVAAAWLGLAVGLVDLAVTLARIRWLQHGIARKTPHLVWMIPASCLVLFVAFGALAAVAARPLGRRGPAAYGFALASLAAFAVLVAIPGLKAAACLALALGIASWAGPWAAGHAGAFGALVRRTLPALAAVVLGLAGWSFGREWLAERAAVAARGPAPSAAPDVYVLVMDTVRADATSLHGAARDTTPNLRRLAASGVVFERAIAPSPWTLPSHASLFTGLWPWQLEVGIDRPLGRGPGAPETLAEWFAARGYATGGFAANTVFCSAEYGLARGFAHYEDHAITAAEVLRCSSLGWWLSRSVARRVLDEALPRLGRAPRHPFESDVRQKSAAEVNAAALRWIDAQEAGRPVFAFLNYMDAHDPYLPPPGAAWRYARPSTAADYRLLKGWADVKKEGLGERELRLARDAYDDGIAYLDGQIGRLLEGLERRGRLRDAVVVVTSDHGEHFGEHGHDDGPVFGHATTLYQAEVWVPLLIAAPGRVPAGVSVARPASLRDVAATLAGVTGLPGPALPGDSLAPAWIPEVPDVAAGAGVLAEVAMRSALPPELRYREERPGLARAVVAGEWSYHRIGDGREELYDLAADPGEARDLAAEPAARADLEAMRAVLEALIPGAG